VIRSGVVTELRNSPLTAHVRLSPISACGSCSQSGGCGVQLLPTSNASVSIDCQLEPSTLVSVGDTVQVQLPDPDKSWLPLVALAYGIPSLGMVFGAIVGYWLAIFAQMPQSTDSFSLVGFVAGLAGGLFAWRQAEKSLVANAPVARRAPLAKIVRREVI